MGHSAEQTISRKSPLDFETESIVPQVTDSEEAKSTDDVVIRSPLSPACAVAFILIAGLLGAGLAVMSANAFSFGDLASIAAGENPPRDESLYIASLMKWQAYANALLTGVGLSLLILFASWGLNAISRDSAHKWPSTPIRSLFLAVTIGGVCLMSACMAFRMHQVGTQNLITAVLIHALIWSGLGLIVAHSMQRSHRAGQSIPLSVLGGCLWGASFPVLVALIDPGAYVERLFAGNGLIGMWGGVGSVVLLTAGFLGNTRAPKKAADDEQACEVTP